MEETRPVRKGEELDAKRLQVFLASELGLHGSEIDIAQFPAGSSNLTYLIRIGSDEFVLRRPPFGNTVATAHDMKREFRVLSKLSCVYPPAPRPLVYSDDTSVIGSEFYLMERRHGLIIRGSAPKEIEASELLQEKVCKAFIATLAELHLLDPKEADLGGLGRPEGYVRRQVEGWSQRYFTARINEASDLEKVIIWLNEKLPAEAGASLIHNDYKFDNIMLDSVDPTNITTVLDWEMVTVGDPLMDLGTTLGYWMSKDEGDEMLSMPFNPRVLMENISRTELVEMYARKVRRDIPDILFYYVFGTFKIAVICQQIYARFVKGSTTDKRFAEFDKFVETLGKIGWRAVQVNRI